MFTGIVTGLGRVSEVIQREKGIRATISCDGFGLDDVAIGDSIACSGACLTVVARTADTFSVDVSEETLRCTTGLDRLDAQVNLEKALRLSDRLGGHLVSGHIDGVGEVLTFAPAGESWELQLHLPQQLEKFVAVKGSIAIDGVSLTVNGIDHQTISINIIPHTLAATSFKRLAPGAKVNVEVDLIARHLARLAKFAG